MVLFLDVFLLENFIVNLFLLHITAQTIKLKSKFKYLMIAALIGSVYALTMVYPSLRFFSSFIFKILIAEIMILISFRKRNALFNIKALIVLILYAMLLAGICMFAEFGIIKGNEIFIFQFHFKFIGLFLSAMVLYIFFYRITTYILDRREITSYIYTVDIVLKNKIQRVQAFLDTGNELREPATNLPVMIVEKPIFDEIKGNSGNEFYIPYQVVNGYAGNLEGFKPDYIQIYFKDQYKQVEVIVACCENKLSSIEEYHALLSRGII